MSVKPGFRTGDLMFSSMKLFAFGVVLSIVGIGACDCGGPPADPPDPECPAGEEDCACAAAPDECDVDLSCVADVCVPCAAGADGCACDADGCDDGLVCDDQTTTCRPLLDCAAAGCAPRQVCDAQPGADAVCLPACDSGFTFDPNTNTCSPTPSCDPASPGSIVASCAADGRACNDNAGPVAVCGDCLVDFVEVDGDCVTNDCVGLDCAGQGRVCDTVGGQESCGDCDASHVDDVANNVCVDRNTCADSPCPVDTRCTEATVGTDRVCTPLANCAFNQVENAAGVCLACSACYSGTTARNGVVGVARDDAGLARLAFGNICVCDVEAGFFQSTVDGTVTECDADNDGWVTDQAVTTADQNNGTSPLAQEQRCAIRKIDAFELRTDDGAAGNAVRTDGLRNAAASKRVSVETLVSTYNLPTQAFRQLNGTSFVLLVEPASLDDPGLFASRYTDSSAAKRLRPYGGGALSADNVLFAGEVNPLTKACNDDNDDANFDGVRDVEQTQEFLTPPSLRPDLASTPLFYRMSYFLELDRGFYEGSCNPVDADCIGTYVIQEKHRAQVAGNTDGLNLALTYNDGDGAGGLFGEDPYWETCMRAREPDYVADADDKYNADFAHWYDDCLSVDGVCHTAGNRVGYDGRDPDLLNDVLNPADGDPVTGGRWPGMGHHSQFKCVSFNSVDARDAERRPPTTVLDRASPVDALTSRPAVARTSGLLAGDPANAAGDFTLMPCALDAGLRASNPGLAGGANPADPVMGCAAAFDQAVFDEKTDVAAHPTQNYFIGLRSPAYALPSQYSGGCIAEGAEWGFLCGTSGTSVAVANSQRAFGKLFCACDDFAAGAACDVGCGDERTLSTRGVDFGTVTGLWMCAAPVVTTNGILADVASGFSLVGGVVPDVIPIAPLCENAGNCGTGFALSAPAH